MVKAFKQRLGSIEDLPIFVVARRDFQFFEGNNDIFLANAEKSTDADDGARGVAAAVNHKVVDLANLVLGSKTNS
jgi:hypothetical protein